MCLRHTSHLGFSLFRLFLISTVCFHHLKTHEATDEDTKSRGRYSPARPLTGASWHPRRSKVKRSSGVTGVPLAFPSGQRTERQTLAAFVTNTLCFLKALISNRTYEPNSLLNQSTQPPALTRDACCCGYRALVFPSFL